MSKQFYLFKKPVRGGEDNIFLALWDFLESWTSQNDWMAIFFIIFLGIVFEIILIKICTSFQKKPALPEKGSSDSQENEDSSLKSLTFDKWSIHSFSEERGPPQLFNIIIQSNIDFKPLPWPKSKNLKLTVISQGLSGIKKQKIDGQKRKPEEETGSKGFSAPESRVDDFSERTITSSLTSEENEGNVEKRVSPTDEIMCADTSESKYQERYFSESHMTSSIGTSSSLSPFHSEIQKNFLSHRECPENENKIQLSSKKLFLIMKANKKKSLMFSYDFNFSRMSGITTESEDIDVVPCPPAHLFLSRDQVRLLEENVKYQIPLKSNATLHSKTTLCSRSQESLIQNQHSVRMDISAQAQDFFPGQSAIQNQDFYETQFISQAQQFVNHQDLINSQTDKESRHFAPPQDLRRKSFSSNTQDPFQMQDMNRSQHVVKVPYSAETQDSTKGLNCDKNPIADVQYFVWSEDANKIKYSIQGQNTIFMNARFLVLTVGPNSVAKGVSQLNSIKPKGQKQITTSKLNQYSVYGSVSLSPANKRQKNRRKTLHSKSKFSLKVPSPKSKKTPTSSIFHIIVHHPLKRNKLGCKYNSKKKELHQSEELGSNAGHSIKNMHDNRISDAFHNATNTTISEPPDREKHSTLKVKTDTPRITGLSHSMVKQEKLPDEKEMWNAEYTEERCTFKKPQEHDSEEEEQAQPEAVSQLAQDFRFSLRRKQKPKYVTLQIGQGSSGRGRPQNKEQETQPQILSTQMTWGMSPCPTVDPFQVEKVKHSRDRLTGRETADPQNPPTVPERLPAGDIFTGTPECGIPFRESPTKTLEDHMVEQKEALKRASPAVAPRCFTIHMLPLLYSKRQTIRKKIPRTKSVLNPKCVNTKVKKLAILLMPDINRRGTPCHVKRLRGNLKILIKQMLSGKMMTDMFLNALYPHRSTSPHVRTHSRVNAENHNHTKLKQEQSQTEREEKCSDSVNKESDSGNTLEKAQLQDEVRGDKEAPPKAFLPDSCNLRLDAHPEEELKTEEERHHPITSAEAIMESVSSSVMDPSHAENMKKILTAQIDLKCTADSEIPPPTSEKSLIGDLSSQTREADVSNYGSDTRETSHCFAETRAEFPKDLPTTFPEAFNGHVPDFTRSKVKRKRLRFSHIDYTTRPKSIHMKTMKPSVSQLFNIIGHREKLESNFKTKFEKSNQANELVYEFLNALYSPMHSTLKVEANSFCHAQLKQELTDEGRSQYADVFDESSTLNNIEAKVQDGEEVEQNPLLAAAAQHGRQSSADACQGKETHLDKPDPALNCLTQELQHQACFTQTAMQSEIQTGPGKAEELQKTNKTGNAKIAPTGLKIPSPKAGKSLFDQHLNMTTECGLPSDGNPKKQLDSYSVGKNSELPKDFQVTFLMSSDSVEPFVSKSKRKKNTSRTARRQITVSHRTIRQKKPSISHMLNDSQSKGLPCNLKTKMKNPQQNKNVADALLDILHSKVSVFPNSKTSSRLSLEMDIQRITRLGHMQLMQEKPPNEGRGCCPDSIDESGLSNNGKNGKQEEGEHEALAAPENSQDFIFRPYQENHDLVKSDEELKKPESIHNQVQPQIPILQTILDSSPCPILDHFQFGMVEHSARFSPPKSGEAKMDEIFSTRACAVPSEAAHRKEWASGIEKKEIVTLDCCLPVCFTSRRKRNFKQYLSMKTLGNSKHEILKAKKPSISYILNIKGGTGPNHKKKLGFNLTTKVKEANQSKKTADKMCPFMSAIHNINTYSEIGRGKNMLGEKSLSSEQVEQAISHEGDVLSDNTQGANLQGEEEEESEQGPLLKVVLQHSQHFVFCSGQREELDFHKSENKRSGNILFVTEQDVLQQMQLPDPVQTEKPERSHQIQNGTVCTASSKLPLIKSKESLIGEVLVDTMKCSDSRDGSHMKELYSCGKEEKGEFKKDHQATVLESLDVTTPYPPESKRQRKTFTCTTLKNKMSPKGLIMKARKTPILPIFNIPGNGCLKNLPSKILTSQIIDFLIHIKHFTVLEDLRIERKEGLVQKLPAVILQSLDLPTLALPTSKRYTLKHIHKKNKMSPKCVTFKTKKAPISQTFSIRKHGTLIHGRQFECSFKAMMKQGKPAAHIILNAIPFAMPISCDMKVHERMKVKTDMSWKMRFSHELREQERSSLDGERAWCMDSKDKRGSTSQSAKKVEVQGREAALQNSQHFSFNGHKGKEPHLVKSDLELKNSARKKIPDSLPTAQKLQQQTIFTQNISRSISCSILNLLQLEKLPKWTKTQKRLNDTGSSKILSPMPRKSISESLIVTAQSGSPFEEIPRKELPSSIPKGGIRLQKNFQVRTLESFDFSMPSSPEFKRQGNTVQICKPKTGETQMASVLRTFNVTRSGALCQKQEQEHILENVTKEIPLVLSNISINTFLSSIPVSPVIKMHKKLKAKKSTLRKNSITQLKQDEGKRLNTYSSNKWSTSNNTSESRWQNEKEKEGNEMLFEGCLQFLNGTGSGRDQKMPIAEQEVQQKTLVSTNVLGSICSPLIPLQTKNLKKTIPPQKDKLQRNGEKIPHPKSRKATLGDLLVNETTFGGSPTRMLDVNNAVSLQPKEEKEDVKTRQYMADQNLTPTKSGSSVLGDPGNKSCRRKVGGHIAEKHEDLQKELPTMSKTPALYESKMQKRVLKFPERKNLTYFWSQKTPFPKAGKSETDLAQCDAVWVGNPRTKWESPVSEEKAWNENDLVITFFKPLDFSSFVSSDPKSQSYTSKFVSKKSIKSSKHVTLKARKPPILHLLHITGCLRRSHKKKKQHKFKNKMKDRQWNENVGEPLFHATEGAKIPPPELVTDKPSVNTTVRDTLYNTTLHKNLDLHITEEMAGLGENFATTYWGPLDFFFPVLSDCASQINTVQLPKQKIILIPKCLTMKKHKRPISQILKINRQFTTKHRKKLRSNLKIKIKERQQGKTVAGTFPNAIHFTLNISGIKRQSRLETGTDRVSRFSSIQPMQMDLPVEGLVISSLPNVTGHSDLSISKEQEQKIDIDKDKIVLNADLKLRHASMPVRLPIQVEHSPSTWDIYEECSEKRNAPNKAKVREKEEYEKQITFSTPPQYTQPFEFGANQEREPGPFKPEASLINTVRPRDITPQKTDVDLIDQKVKMKAVEGFNPEFVSFSRIYPLQIKKQKTNFKTANRQTIAKPKILIPTAGKSSADVHSVNTVECGASLQQREGMALEGQGSPALHDREQEPLASGTTWNPAYTYTLKYAKIRKPKARAKTADVKNSVHPKRAKLKEKKPLDSQMPQTTGYGTQSNKKESRCDINIKKKVFQQGTTLADLDLSTICDSGSILSQIKGFLEVKIEKNKQRKLIHIPQPRKLNKLPRRKLSSSQSTDKNVISTNIKILKQYIREQREKHQIILLDILSQGRDRLAISQQVKTKPDHVTVADLEREVHFDLSSWKGEVNCTTFDIPQIRTHAEIECLTAPRVKEGDVDMVDCSVSLPWGRAVPEKTDNSLSSKGQDMFLTELDDSQQICKEQELPKQGSISMTNRESTACPIMELLHLENTGEVAKKYMDSHRKNISHLLGREGLTETDISQGQKFLCINLEVQQNRSGVTPDHIPENIRDFVSCHNREPLLVEQSGNATREENVSTPVGLNVNPWRKEQFKLTDIPIKSNRQKMNFSEKVRANQLNSSNQNKEIILECISSRILHHLHFDQLKKEGSAKGRSSTVLGPVVEKSSKEAGTPVDQPPCSEGINLHIRGRKEHQQESMCKVLPTSISHSSWDILQIKSPWVKKALKAIDSPVDHTSNTEGKEQQPKYIHQTFIKFASHSSKKIFQSKMPCKKKASEEVINTVDYTPSAERIGSLITRKGEQQAKWTCEALPKPTSPSKTSPLQINTPVQQVKLDDTNMMHCEYLTSQAEEALKGIDDIAGYTQKNKKRQNLLSIEQKQKHPLIPYENFLGHMSYPQNDPWLRQHLMPQPKEPLSEAGNVSSRTKGLDLFSKDDPNTLCEYGLEQIVPSIPPKQMKKQNTTLPLESCSKTIKYLSVSFPKGKKSPDRAQVIDLISNGSSPKLRIRKRVQSCKAYQKKVPKEVCLPGMFLRPPPIFMPILPESKIQKGSVKQRVKKDTICSKRRTSKLKKSVFPNILDITDCGTPGNRPELQCNIKEETVNKKQRKDKPDLVVTNICEFIPALPHLKLNTQAVDGIIANNLRKTQPISQAKEKDGIKEVSVRGIMNLNLTSKGKESSHTLNREELPVQIKQESKVQMAKDKSGVQLTNSCSSLPSLLYPNLSLRLKVGKEKSGIPRSCLPPLKLQTSSNVRETSFVGSINRDSLSSVAEPEQHLPQKKEDNIVYVKDIKDFKCATFKGKKTPFKYILHGKGPQWNNKEQEKEMQEDESDADVVQNEAHASIPSSPSLEWSPGIKEVHMRGTRRFCFPLTLEESTGSVETCEDPTRDTLSCSKEEKYMPQKEENQGEITLEDRRHPERIAWKAKQFPTAQELQLNTAEKEKKMQEDKQVGIQSKFCASISLPPYSAVGTRIKETAKQIKTSSSLLQPTFQGPSDIGKKRYKKPIYGDISNSVKKAKEHIMQEKDERRKMVKVIPSKKKKSLISQEIQWDIKGQETKIQKFKCQSSVVLASTSTSMPDASPLKLDTEVKKAEYLTEATRYSLPERSQQKSSDAGKKEDTSSVGGDSTSNDVKTGQGYEPQKGENGRKIAHVKYKMYHNGTTPKAKMLPLPRVLDTPRGCGLQVREVQTNTKEKLGHKQERKSELDEALTRLSLPQFKLKKDREGKGEEQGITRPFLSRSRQKESSDADKLKYTVSPSNNSTRDSKRAKHMMQKEEDKIHVFEKDIMHHMCVALKAKKAPLFHILKSKALQVEIKGEVKRGQESNKERILSEICPFVASLTHLEMDAIKEEGEPGIIRNYVLCLDLHQSLASGQTPPTKSIDSSVEKGKHLPQTEKDRVQNRTKVEKDFLEMTGLSPLQFQFPVSSGVGKIKYADSSQGISSGNAIIKVNQHMPFKEVQDRVKIEDGKSGIFPQITLRAEVSPVTQVLSRKKQHLNIQEQWKAVHRGHGKPEVVLRQTSASLPCPSPLKQDTRMNGEEDTVGGTQSYFPPLKSQDPSNPGKKAYTQSCDGHMLKDKDILKMDIEDNVLPIYMDLMAKELQLPQILKTKELQWKIREQKSKVQEDKNELVTNTKHICTSLLTLPYLKLDTPDREGNMISVTKLPVPQLQSKELPDAVKIANAEAIDGELSNKVKKLNEHVLQEEEEREKKVDVKSRVGPENTYLIAKTSPISRTCNLGDQQWRTEEQEGKVKEVPCEPCAPTSSPLHLNTNNRIKGKSMQTLTRSSVSLVHVQESADSEAVVYAGPTLSDILIRPQEGERHMPQDKEEDGVEIINLMFPKHQEKKIQERKDQPGVLLTQSPALSPSLPHIDLHKEILVDDEMLVLKRFVLQRIPNAGEAVHTEPSSTDTMQDVLDKKQHVPQKEERHREKTVAVRGLTRTTDRTLKKSPPSHTLHRTELHLNIGRQEREKHDRQNKPSSMALRKAYFSKPSPAFPKLDKGTQADREGLGVKTPCLFPLRLSALSDVEKVKNTEAAGAAVRRRKQYMSQKEKMYEVHMKIRMQHQEARISPISRIFNTKEFVLNIRNLKRKEHNREDEPRGVQTRTFLSIPSAPLPYLDSGSKTDKEAPGKTGSACLQKNPQESLDIQEAAIRESVSGNRIIVKRARCSVPQDEAVQQWTSNFMISVQQRNETPQVTSKGDLCQLIGNSQHEDIHFPGFDTLRPGKRLESFFTGLQAKPEKNKRETFTTLLSYPTMEPTKIENLKKETEIMGNFNHKTCPQTSVSLPKEISREIYATLGTPGSSKGFPVSEEDDHQTISKAPPTSADSCKYDKISKTLSSKVLVPQRKGSLKKMNIRKSNACHNTREQEIVMKKQVVQWAESGHKTMLNSSLSLKFPLQNGKQKTPLEVGVHEQTAVYPGLQMIPKVHVGIRELDATRGGKEQVPLIPEQEECILESFQNSPSPCWTFPLQSGDLKEKNETDTSMTVNAKQKNLEMEDRKLKIDTSIAVHLKEDKIEMHKHTTVNLEKELVKMDTSNTVNLNALSLKAEKSQVKTQGVTDMANSYPIKQKCKKELAVPNAKQNIQPQKLFQKHTLDSLYAYIPLSHKFEGWKGRLTIADLKRELCSKFLTMKIPKHPILQILDNTGHGTPIDRKKLEYDFNKPKNTTLWNEGASGIFIRSLSISVMSPSQTEKTIESEMSSKRGKRTCLSKFQEKSPNASKIVKRNNSNTVKKGDQNFKNIVPEDSYLFVVEQQQMQKLSWVKSEANLNGEISKKNLTPHTEERVVSGHDIPKIIKEPDLFMIKQEEKMPKPILTPPVSPLISEDPKENVETHVKSTLTMSIYPLGVEQQPETHVFVTMKCVLPPEHMDQSEPIQNTTTQKVQQQKAFPGTVPMPPQVKSNEIKIVVDNTNAASLLPLYEAIKNVFESWIKNMTQDKAYADRLEKVQGHKSDDWGPDTTSTTICPQLQPKPIVKGFSPKLKNKLTNHLVLKALQIKLNLIPEMAQRSFQTFNFYPKLAISEDKSWRLYPRYKKMYFLSLEGIDTINLNVKHKHQKGSPHNSCMQTLTINVSSGSEEDTTKLKSIKKLESGTSAVAPANEMPLSHILQKYQVEEKDKLLIHFSVKTLEIQMKVFPRTVTESYAMANAQDRGKPLSKCIGSGVKIPKPRNRVSLLFEEKHQIALDLQCKNLHFSLGLPVQSMSLKPNTLSKHILKLNTVAICKEVDNSREGDSLSIDTELLEKHSSFKNESPHGNSSLIRKFLEPTHVCPPDPEQHGSVKKGTTAFSVLKSHVTPEKNKQDHIWFQETHTHESFDLKTQENVPTLVDSHSIPISEDFTYSQTFIESSTDLEEGSALEEHASEEYMFLEASPYLSQESQNILFELQKGIPLESAYMMKKIKTDLKPSYSEDSGSNNNRGCRKHSSIVTPPSYESHRTRKHRLSFKMQPPDRLCHRSLNTVEVPFVSSSVSFSEEKFSWITKNRTSYPSAPLTESNMKLHLRKTQDKPHRHPESKKRKKTKVDLFRKNVHWDRDYSYIQRKEKCTRKKQVCDCGSERAHFPSKHKSAAQPHQEDVNFHSERKQSQPFFYACIPADSLEIIPKTIRWTIPQKTLKKRNFRVPLVAKISSCYSIWSSSRKLLGSLLKSFHPVHQY